MAENVFSGWVAQGYDAASAHMYAPEVLGPTIDFLAAEAADTDAGDALIDRYHFLRGFAAGHPEAAAIYRAID